MKTQIQKVGRMFRITASPGSSRGSVLVIVIGVLALMAILVTIYATLGQADRRTSQGMKRALDLDDQMNAFANYFADFVGKDALKARRVQDPTDTTGNRAERDRYIRVSETNPSIDPYLLSQSTEPALRYRPTYFSSDTPPANAPIPPSAFTPGAVLTRWRDGNNPDGQFPDPRLPGFTPWLADSNPTWLRTLRNNQVPNHRDPLRPWLEDRDWAMISNFALDGRFVNLATIRNNFAAESGIGLDLLGRARTTYGLTLLDDQGRSTLDLALPPAWTHGRTSVSWAAAGPGNPVEYYPHDFTANQRGMFRRLADLRLAAGRVAGLDRGYTGTFGTIVPGDWEYFDNQLADADGDGLADSRWFEFRDASDPGRDGAFGTPDDIIRGLVRENGNLRWFAAARAVDLSSKVNVNTATQFRTAPDAMTPAGLDPSFVDLERILRMSDVAWYLPNTGYQSYAQPAAPSAAGGGGITSNYRAQANYGSFITLNGRDHSVADMVGATAFSAIINARARGEVPGPGTTTRRPDNVPYAFAWGNGDLFAPLAVEGGVWPFDGTPNRVFRQSSWKSEYRSQLYNMFARDPGASMISSADGNAAGETRRYGPWLYQAPDPLLNVNGVDVRNRLVIRDNSFQIGGVFGIQSEIDLRAFERINVPLTSSALELTAGGRFYSETGERKFAHFSPLRENRPRDLETLARDFATATDTGITNNPDGDVDPDALLQARTDVRQYLTGFSGARPLFNTDITSTLTALDDREVAVHLPEIFALLSRDISSPSDQVLRQEKISQMFIAAADALMPFAHLRDPGANPRNSAWFTTVNGNYLTGVNGAFISRGEQRLFYGADREFLPGVPQAYRGNAAELSLRLTAAWLTNVIAGNLQPKTAIDPANPIHPDDLQDDRDVITALWGGTNIANNTNLFSYPVNNSANALQDRNYDRHPRLPRGALTPVPANDNQLEDSLTYTDAVEYRLNTTVNPPRREPVRTRSEAYDRPVVTSVLVDEGFRNKMESVLEEPRLDTPNVTLTNNTFRPYPGWNKGNVAQSGNLAPRIAGRLDLGKDKLAPSTSNGINQPNGSPQAEAEDAKLSVRAFNQYSITPQPFIVQATTIMLYCDTPPGARGGDTDGQTNAGGPGGGAVDPVTVNAQIQSSGVDPASGDGDLAPVAGNPNRDHVLEIVAFQLHNPFDVPLSLSSLGTNSNAANLEGRTLPDMTRAYIRQDSETATSRYAGQLVSNNNRIPAVPSTSMFYPKAEETRYYVEFSGRFYALVGTDATGVERRAVTLEPGETRWFYASDKNLNTAYTDMLAIEPSMSGIVSGQTTAVVETWINNLLATHEPLGMSYIDLTDRNNTTAFPNLPNIRSPKTQRVFQNAPTRLVRVNPVTMSTIPAKLQPMPRPGETEARRRFFDNRRAVRLWRVNREVYLNENAQANDLAFTSEGAATGFNGSIDYQGRNNLLSNDQLVDVLRDPRPWRKGNNADGSFYELDDNESNWVRPTLHGRLDDRTPNFELSNDGISVRAGEPHPEQGIAFINWGSVRRPADPKLDMPLFRHAGSDPNIKLPEVPTGLLPAYCLEVKSSLPFRAGVVPPQNATPYSYRTSLNWNMINGRRGLTNAYLEEARFDSAVGPFDDGPRWQSDVSTSQLRIPTGGNPGSDINLPHTRVARVFPVDETKTALATLISRGVGTPLFPQPVRLHQSVNLAPQLQDDRGGERRADTEPVNFASADNLYKQSLRDRLTLSHKNGSGIPFSRLRMRLPMILPPVHRATDRDVRVPPIRQADLLMVPAVGPYEVPLNNNGVPWYDAAATYTVNGRTENAATLGLSPRSQRVLDTRWTTLAEAAAQALDYDFDENWKTFPPDQRFMPADYRLGGALAGSAFLAQFDPVLANVVDPAEIQDLGLNIELEGCLDRGCFRTDRFVAFNDAYDQSGARNPDGLFTAPRVNAIGGIPVGDERLGSGVPLALNLLDRFRTTPYGSKTSMVQGTINLNTASLAVKRAIPMLSPDVRGWMSTYGRELTTLGTGGQLGFSQDSAGMPFDPLGEVFARDIFTLNDNLNVDEQFRTRSIYSNAFEAFDIAAATEAYTRKSLVTSRPIQIDGDRRRNFPIDISFRSDMVDYRGQLRGPGLNEPELGRGFYTGISAIREHTGMASIGELLCVRQDPLNQVDTSSLTDRRPYNLAADDRFKFIKNWDTLERQFGSGRSSAAARPDRDRPFFTYFSDNSIDRFARDNARQINLNPADADITRVLAPSTGLDPTSDPADEPNYVNGKPLQGLMTGMVRDPVNQRGPLMPIAVPDTLQEKYVIANAALGSVSVRSDAFCVWYVLRGYAPTDVTGLAPDEPMIPSVERRYVMVLDRSNVTKLDDKPRVLFVQEVPIR